jgi:hypothetical protein
MAFEGSDEEEGERPQRERKIEKGAAAAAWDLEI